MTSDGYEFDSGHTKAFWIKSEDIVGEDFCEFAIGGSSP